MKANDFGIVQGTVIGANPNGVVVDHNRGDWQRRLGSEAALRVCQQNNDVPLFENMTSGVRLKDTEPNDCSGRPNVEVSLNVVVNSQ